MAPVKDAGDVMTSLSSRRPLYEEQGAEDDDYAIAAIIVALFLICVIIVVVICSCCQRCQVTHNGGCSTLWSCSFPCSKTSGRRRGEDLNMGYFPANITVNSAALEHGVPDIFLRANSSLGDGRISLEPYSFDNSSPRVPDSPTAETSGAWSEYLRQVTMGRGVSAGIVAGTGTGNRHLPSVFSQRRPPQGDSHPGKDVPVISNPVN